MYHVIRSWIVSCSVSPVIISINVKRGYSKATRPKSRHPYVRFVLYIFAHPMGNSDLRAKHKIYIIYIFIYTNKQTTNQQEACEEMPGEKHLITEGQKKVTALPPVVENKLETACATILSS